MAELRAATRNKLPVLIVEVLQSVTGIAEHFQVGVSVIAAITVFVMGYHPAIRTAATFAARSALHQRELPVSLPPQVGFHILPIAIPFLGNPLALCFVAALQGAGKSWLGEQRATYWARPLRATATPVRVCRSAALPLSDSTTLAFSVGDSHAVTRTESSSTVTNGGRPFEKPFPARLAGAFHLRHSCIVSSMGYA